MKNSNDYEAGLTTPMVNPKTGKTVAGVVARNLRLGNGGASGYAAAAILEAMKPMELLMQQTQLALVQNTQVIGKLLEENKELKEENSRLKR